MAGIYLHIPFCARKCIYCDFFSVSYQKQLVEAYVQALVRNIKYYAAQNTDCVFHTIYFGGGTPSLLSAGQISEILNACAAALHLAEQPEITLEYNPSGNRQQYLHDLYQAGVNRLSIGTQSFSDVELQLLSRTHTAQENVRTVTTAYAQGFRNISCDLMLAVPRQTQDSLAQSLQTLTALPVTHCSAYLLQIEAATVLAGQPALLAELPEDDTAADFYLQAVHTLEMAGFRQYEVSSFAKPGYESRHNLQYWHCEAYLGIGAGAYSCWNGRRFFVEKDIQKFCACEKQEITFLPGTACDLQERTMLALRTSDGIPEQALSPQARTKADLFLKAGYLTRKPDGHIVLTPEGFAVSNAVIAELI